MYAIGIDGEGERTIAPRAGAAAAPHSDARFRCRSRACRAAAAAGRQPAADRRHERQSAVRAASDDRVNVAALRDMTDDSGGRTEIVRDPQDLDPATAGIADELSKQYYLGYTSPGKKDGRWHSIRVEVKNRAYRVRSRRGYVAS